MAVGLCEQIKELYNNNLYQDIVQTIRLLCDSGDDRKSRFKEKFGFPDGLNILIIYATSLQHTKEYRIALEVFQQALSFFNDKNAFKRESNKSTSIKRKNSSEDSLEETFAKFPLCSSSEIHYRMHMCYKDLGDYGSAIKTLQSIPQDSMNLKILTSLGDLFMETNNPKEGLEFYTKAVLKNPLALHTLKKYLNYASYKMADDFVKIVSKKISDDFSQVDSIPLTKFITANNLARIPKNFREVCLTFFGLRTSNPPSNRDNIYMILETAKYLYYDGFVSNSNLFYKYVYGLSPDLMEGKDCYAACLYRDNNLSELQTLTGQVISSCSSRDATRMIAIKAAQTEKPTLVDSDSNNLMFSRVEPWIVIGYYNLSKRDPKSVLFANKALQIDPNCEEALILKTLIFSKKVGETLGMLRSPREFIDEIEQFIFKTKHKRLYVRFEILKYLAEAILVKDGRDTAENYVKEAISRYGMTARVCTFYSNLITTDRNSTPADRKIAIKLLEEAVRLSPYYLSAVLTLSKHYMEMGRQEDVLKMLLKVTDKFDYQFIHKMIIDCYHKLGQEENAAMHETASCSKNPLDVSKITAKKIKEEILNDSLIELDMTISMSINPIGDNTDPVEMAAYPPNLNFRFDTVDYDDIPMKT